MKTFVAVLLFFASVTTAFGHAGHIHTYMGTVTTRQEHGFAMKTTDGKGLTIETTAKTKWAHADGRAAKASDLAVGDRVVVRMMTDDSTAAEVKMAAPKK